MAKSKRSTRKSSKKADNHWSSNRSAPVDKTKRSVTTPAVSEDNIVAGTRRRAVVNYSDTQRRKNTKKKAHESKNTLEARQAAASEATKKIKKSSKK